MTNKQSNQGDIRTVEYLKEWTEVFGHPKSAEHIFFYLKEYLLSSLSPVKALDLFSGAGAVGDMVTDYFRLYNLEGEVVYSDFATKMVQELNTKVNTRTHLALSQITRNVVNADVRKLPFTNEVFNLVTARYGFNNLEKDEWNAALSESLRVLKSGGLLLIQDHFLSGERFCELGNYIEQTIGQIEGRNDFPYFPTTEKMNLLLRDNPLVRIFEKTGFAMDVNLYKRMIAKAKNNSRLEVGLIRGWLDEMYRIILERWETRVIDDNIPVNCVTYAIIKK